jgi:predicted peroxiredoxin
MEKVIHKLINEFTEGVDTYTYNGSTWLIFTESKQWVIELTDGKTLWYNYNFFKGIFSYTSMDVVDNQQYITKWVEDNIINKELTYATLFRDARDRKQQFEDAIENGVRELYDYKGFRTSDIKDTIQNGVKKTNSTLRRTILGVDDIIQNGIKETRLEMNITEGEVDDIIQDGVKHTEIGWHQCNNIDDAIEKGVKYTFPNSEMGTSDDVESVINNGVRDTQSNPYENESWIEGVIKKGEKLTLNTEYMPTSMVEDIIQSGVRKTLWISVERESLVEKTINNGVKETNPVDVMKFFDNKMEEVLQNGVKETLVSGSWNNDKMEDVLQNGVKETNYDTDNYTDDVNEVIREGVRTSHPRQYVGGDIVDKVIDKGIIETHDDVYHHKGRIDGVIKNGVKETKTPGKDGDIMSTVEWMMENNSTSYPKMIDDVIENGVKETFDTEFMPKAIVEDIIQNGVKETKVCHYTDPKTNLIHVRWPDEIDDIIENGEKINGTYAGGQRQSEKCKSVVEYGTKNPTD